MATEAARLKPKTSWEEKQKPTFDTNPAFSWKDLATTCIAFRFCR